MMRLNPLAISSAAALWAIASLKIVFPTPIFANILSMSTY